MSEASTPSKGKTIGIWVLTVLVGGSMIAAGIPKLLGKMAEEFVKMGFPVGFSFVTGLFEVVGGVLLFVPRYSVFGAIVIMTTMVGACVVNLAHIMTGGYVPVLLTIVLGLMALAVGWFRSAPLVKLLSK